MKAEVTARSTTKKLSMPVDLHLLYGGGDPRDQSAAADWNDHRVRDRRVNAEFPADHPGSLEGVRLCGIFATYAKRLARDRPAIAIEGIVGVNTISSTAMGKTMGEAS